LKKWLVGFQDVCSEMRDPPWFPGKDLPNPSPLAV
jgi:hypothetical protein